MEVQKVDSIIVAHFKLILSVCISSTFILQLQEPQMHLEDNPTYLSYEILILW